MDRQQIGVRIVLPSVCAGALLLLALGYAYMRYRRSASGVSPHDVSSAGRQTGSWSSRLRNSLNRNSAVSQEFVAKEEEDKNEWLEEGSGEVRQLELIVTPKAKISNSEHEDTRRSPVARIGSPTSGHPGQGRQHEGPVKGQVTEEEEDMPIQYSPPVSGNVSGLYFDAMTVSLSDVTYSQKSGLSAPESVKNSKHSSPLTRSPLNSPFPVMFPAESSDLEAGWVKPKPGWKSKWGQLWGRSPSSSLTGSSGGNTTRQSSAGGDGDASVMSVAVSRTGDVMPFSPDISLELAETRVYTSKELNKATNGFDKRNEIGVGGFGKVYKGSIEGNQYIAIKKVSADSHQGVREFVSEVSITGRMRGLRHPNLVPLLGWCQEKGELLLVYSFFPAGSLDRILHSRIAPLASNPLSWERRYKIISDIASALAFLHSGWSHCVIHRDVKTSNILLDGDKAVLGDFGLARQHNFGQLPLTTAPAGTPGYLPPEVALATSDRHMTDKLDVYSFGVVALEIVSGRRPIDYRNEQPMLVDWVWSLHEQDRLLEAVDPRLAGQFDTDQLLLVLQLGLLCSHLNPRTRCKMADVVKYLQRHMVPPSLPPTRPIVCIT